MADNTYTFLSNDDHESRPTTPTVDRRKLSFLLDADDEEGTSLTRRASAMSKAFGVASTDTNFADIIKPVLIVGQLFFMSAVDIATLKETLKTRLLEIPRFRCIVRESDDKDIVLKARKANRIDMDYHVKSMTKPDGKPWSREEIDSFCSAVYAWTAEDRLDYRHPPWRFFVFSMEDGRTLVLPIIDHVLVDGVAAVATLMAIPMMKRKMVSASKRPLR